MEHSVEQQVVAVLEARSTEAALAAEVAAVVDPPLGRPNLDALLERMVKDHTIIVADHAAPDIHLESADLRIVALVRERDHDAAMMAADATWNEWLRAFFSTHRCQ